MLSPLKCECKCGTEFVCWLKLRPGAFKTWAAPFWTATSPAVCLSIVAMRPWKNQSKSAVLHTKAEHGSTFNAALCIIVNAWEGGNIF